MDAQGALAYRKHKIKIMMPDWLQAVRDAWTKAVVVDYKAVRTSRLLLP